MPAVHVNRLYADTLGLGKSFVTFPNVCWSTSELRVRLAL